MEDWNNMEKGSIQLSKRLQAVAALVPECGCVADIGCDHGYTSIFLVQQGTALRAIAMDVREGPLARAREHISRQRLEPYIQVRLSDGLEQLRPGEADAVVIAGMGGATMEKILRAGRPLLEGAVTLALQPQSEIPGFRRFLWQEGYRITREDMVLEEGKYYPMMQVRSGSTGPYTAAELAFGPLLLRQRHPVLFQYLNARKQLLLEICRQLQEHGGEKAKGQRMEELAGELALIEQALWDFYNIGKGNTYDLPGEDSG